MAPKVLFVTPSNAPAGYFLSFSEQTNTLELVTVKSKAKTFPDEATANEQRATVMGALTPDGRHVTFAVDIRDSDSL